MKKSILPYILILILNFGCSTKEADPNIEQAIGLASAQMKLQLENISWDKPVRYPRTIDSTGNTHYIMYQDWTSGFFTGSIWYMYALTGDSLWKKAGEKLTKSLSPASKITWHHDVGFIINSSFGHCYQFTKNPQYANIIVKAAKSLSTRYRPKVGIIQSWNVNKGWQSQQGWQCPVIIDNMMNLELLFRATQISGDSSYYNIAVSHADKTLKNHFRGDNSSFHVVDYFIKDGGVHKKQTAQGFSDQSAWARGQAWGLYGFTMCFRETGKIRYLRKAQQIADFILNNKNMPRDFIPYWDFNAEGKYAHLRDASAGAIMASALYELSTLVNDGSRYSQYADIMVSTLCSPLFSAKEGQNNGFILKHSVGSLPRNKEIDAPLNYADYYFLEALYRKMHLQNTKAN